MFLSLGMMKPVKVAVLNGHYPRVNVLAKINAYLKYPQILEYFYKGNRMINLKAK